MSTHEAYRIFYLYLYPHPSAANPGAEEHLVPVMEGQGSPTVFRPLALAQPQGNPQQNDSIAFHGRASYTQKNHVGHRMRARHGILLEKVNRLGLLEVHNDHLSDEAETLNDNYLDLAMVGSMDQLSCIPVRRGCACGHDHHFVVDNSS